MIRRILFFMLLIALSSGIPQLLPAGWAGPDLFLLTALVVALRYSAVTGVFAGYGLGLLEDLLGHGYFGLHALGLAGAVLMFHSLDGFFNLAPRLREGLGVVLAVVGQWLSFLILTYWLRNDLVTVQTLYTLFPLQMLFALLLYLPWKALSRVFWGPLEDFSDFGERLR